MEDCSTVFTAQSASVYVSMQPHAWLDHVTLRRGAAHKHTHRVDQAQANCFLWLGNKQCTCHTHHTSNKCTHTHTHLDSVCVCGVKCARVFFPVQAQSDLSRPTGAWFVLGMACWVTTPPDRREHNENRKPILRWQKKKTGRNGLCSFATTVTLGNGLYCNKPYQKQKWHRVYTTQRACQQNAYATSCAKRQCTRCTSELLHLNLQIQLILNVTVISRDAVQQRWTWTKQSVSNAQMSISWISCKSIHLKLGEATQWRCRQNPLTRPPMSLICRNRFACAASLLTLSARLHFRLHLLC